MNRFCKLVDNLQAYRCMQLSGCLLIYNLYNAGIAFDSQKRFYGRRRPSKIAALPGQK